MRLELSILGLALGLSACAPSAFDDDKDSGSSAADDGEDGSSGDDGSSEGDDGASDGGDDGTSDGGDDGTSDGDDGGGGAYTISINEWMASNGSVYIDPDDPEATPDWVELFNPSAIAVDLEGFTITDDLADPGQHVLPSIVLEPGDFVVLLADEGDGDLHLPFKLGSDGDEIGIFDPDGVPLDRVEYLNLGGSQVAGRLPDGGALHLLSRSTPGESNASAEALDR